jgi:hypothetical protein
MKPELPPEDTVTIPIQYIKKPIGRTEDLMHGIRDCVSPLDKEQRNGQSETLR